MENPVFLITSFFFVSVCPNAYTAINKLFISTFKTTENENIHTCSFKYRKYNPTE